MEMYSFFQESGLFWAFLGAVVAALLPGLGSSMGMGIAGQAATGLAAEKPELAMKGIVLEALPGSQVIYGFVVLFFILYVTLVEGKAVSPIAGLQILMASFPIAVAGLFSAIYQGKVLAGAMNMLAKDEATFAQAMTMGALVETVAILGLLETILMLLKIQL